MEIQPLAKKQKQIRNKDCRGSPKKETVKGKYRTDAGVPSTLSVPGNSRGSRSPVPKRGGVSGVEGAEGVEHRDS